MINTQLKRKSGKGEGITHTTGSTPSYLMRINILMQWHKAGSHNRVGGSHKPNSVSSSPARLQSSVTIWTPLDPEVSLWFHSDVQWHASVVGKIIYHHKFQPLFVEISTKHTAKQHWECLRPTQLQDSWLTTDCSPHQGSPPYSFGRLHPESDTSPLWPGRMKKSLKGNRCI